MERGPTGHLDAGGAVLAGKHDVEHAHVLLDEVQVPTGDLKVPMVVAVMGVDPARRNAEGGATRPPARSLAL